MTALGLDGCKRGWLAVAVDDNGFVDAFIAADIAQAAAIGFERWDVAVLVVDIPIGLPDHGPRQADLQARAFIGPRRSSVFPTPVRAAVESESYIQASTASLDACGKRISQQAWGITPKMREVDTYVRDTPVSVRVFEGHPEVSFRAMSTAPLDHYKKSLSGATQRQALLEAEGILIPPGLEKTMPGADVDDLHDAAAMAWTARRLVNGEVGSLPDPPEVFSDGVPSAIWY